MPRSTTKTYYAVTGQSHRHGPNNPVYLFKREVRKGVNHDFLLTEELRRWKVDSRAELLGFLIVDNGRDIDTRLEEITHDHAKKILEGWGKEELYNE